MMSSNHDNYADEDETHQICDDIHVHMVNDDDDEHDSDDDD